MATILAISSQTVFGPVGNSAAVPPMLAHGHEILQVPTILLSNQPALGKPVARATDDAFFAELLKRISGVRIDGILTGYFATPRQVEIAARFIRAQKKAFVLVDPVIGDNDKLYVDEKIAAAIRTRLIPLASAATPNLFELAWLTGNACADRDGMIAAAHSLGPPEVIVTSATVDRFAVETLLVTPLRVWSRQTKFQPGTPHGSGDYLAGSYLAHRLALGSQAAFRKSMAALDHVIAASRGRKSLAVAAE